MNFIDAVKSGRKIKRKSGEKFFPLPVILEGLSVEDILAEDWDRENLKHEYVFHIRLDNKRTAAQLFFLDKFKGLKGKKVKITIEELE